MSYKIIGKYIKHLDFRIPNSKAFSLLAKDISNYKINIDIKSYKLKDKIIEVVVTLSLNPTLDDIDRINTKIVFSTIIQIEGELAEKELLEEIILIKVPNEVYPEIRLLFVI